MAIRFPGSFEVVLEDTVEEISMFGIDVACDVAMKVVGDHGEVNIEDPTITAVYVCNENVFHDGIKDYLTVKEWLKDNLGGQIQTWFNDNDERIMDNARQALTDAEEGAREQYWDEKIQMSRES